MDDGSADVYARMEGGVHEFFAIAVVLEVYCATSKSRLDGGSLVDIEVRDGATWTTNGRLCGQQNRLFSRGVY